MCQLTYVCVCECVGAGDVDVSIGIGIGAGCLISRKLKCYMHCRRCCLSAAFALHLCCCGGGFCCCCFCCFPFFLLHCGCCALKYALFLRVSAHFWHNWSTNSAGCLPRLWLAPKVALATWHCVYATDSTASGQRNLLAQVLHGNFASKRARQTMQQQQQQRQQQQQQQQQKYQWQSLLPAYACTPPTPPLPLLHPCWVRIFLMSFFFVATAASRQLLLTPHLLALYPFVSIENSQF